MSIARAGFTAENTVSTEKGDTKLQWAGLACPRAAASWEEIENHDLLEQEA